MFMNWSALIASMTEGELTALVLTCALVTIFFGISVIYMMLKLHTLNRRYNSMMKGSDGASFESMLLNRIEDIDMLKKQTQLLDEECVRLDRQQQQCVQKVGVVRFNAFDNTGSDLSFAVAMMNAENSGVVFSGIYGREDTRVYAKPIQQSGSTYSLSNEEKQAVNLAK
jgi:hypothetical protein